MATKVADHVIIVNDYAIGLLNRAHMTLYFEPPKFPDVELEKFIKKLGENFPRFPDKLMKERGWDPFVRRATEISTALYDFYYTFVDIVKFNEKVKQVLVEVSENLYVIDNEMCPELTNYVMELFCNWIRINILMSRSFESSKAYLATYARAHHTVSGNTEGSFSEIALYVQEYAKPLDKIRAILEDHPISPFVGFAVLKTSSQLVMFKERSNMLSRGVFSVQDKTDDMQTERNEHVYTALYNLWRVKEWVIYTYLACPQELAIDGAIDVLMLALRDMVALHVHRGECINIMEEMDALFADFQLKKIKFKLSKYRHHIKDLSNDYEGLLTRRLEFRRYQLVELQTVLAFLRLSPSNVGLAPKMGQVLSLLRVASEEVNWYYYNGFWVDKGHKPFRSSGRFAIHTDTSVVELIYNITEATNEVRRHLTGVVSITDSNDKVTYVTSPVAEYFHMHLHQDREAITTAASALLQSFPLPATVSRLLDTVQEGQQATEPGFVVHGVTTQVRGYDLHRLQCCRLLAILRHKQIGINNTSPTLMAVMSAVQSSIVHTRFIDNLEKLTETAGGLTSLFWYLPLLKRELLESLAKPQKCTNYVGALLQVLGNAMVNVHRLCPEESKSICLTAATAVDDLLVSIVDLRSTWLKRLVLNMFKLGKSLEPQQALSRMMGSNSTNEPTAMPGEESYFTQLQVQAMHQWKVELTVLLRLFTELSKSSDVHIFQYILSPREYVITAMQKSFRELARACVVPSLLRPDGSVNTDVERAILSIDIDSMITNNLNTFLEGQKNPKYLNQTPQQAFASNPANALPVIARPSLMKKNLSILSSLFLQFDRSLNFNFSEIAAAIVQSEFGGIYPRVGGESAGHVTFTETGRGADDAVLTPPIVNYISHWYLNVFTSDLEVLGVQHNHIDQCFEGKRTLDSKGSVIAAQSCPLQVEIFTDRAEATTLLSLISSSGCEILCKYILNTVQRLTERVFSILNENASLLSSLQHRYTEPQVWIARLAEVSRRDEFLSMITQIGVLLTFRQLLLSALYDVSVAVNPVITDSTLKALALAKQIVPDHLFDSRVAPLRALALGCGYAEVGADQGIRDIMRRFKTSIQDHKVWQILPEMVCVSLLSPSSIVTRSQYKVQTEGYHNNAHLLTVTIRDFVACMTALPYQQKTHVPNADELITAALTNVVTVCSYAVVNLHAVQNKVAQSSVTVLLDAYMQSCKGWLNLSILDTCVPYTLLRAHYIVLHEEQSAKYTMVEDEKY